MTQELSNLSNNPDNKVLRVTLLKKNSDGSRSTVPLFDDATATSDLPRKKQTGAYRVVEKKARKGAKRGIRMLEIYLALHERSNKKKKNGWAKDYFKNATKAVRKSKND